jgi:hypothetical protein
MDLIRDEDELRHCSGAEQLFARRDELGLQAFRFLYACVWPTPGSESIRAVFYSAHQGVKRMADISVERGSDGAWTVRHVIETDPPLQPLFQREKQPKPGPAGLLVLSNQ